MAATLEQFQSSLSGLSTSVDALVSAAQAAASGGGTAPAADFQGGVDAVAALKAKVDAAIAVLQAPPAAPAVPAGGATVTVTP